MKYQLALITILLLLGNFSHLSAQTIVHKKAHWTVGADTLKGSTEHTIVLAGQSFIGTSTSATYTLHTGFFPIKFNHVPTNIVPSTQSTPENNALNDVVLTLETEDVFELNDSYIYTFVDGSNDNSFFAIAGNTLQTNTTFDKETKDTYSILLQTDDGDYGKYQKAFIITITNNNDAPDSIMMDVNTIGENAINGTLVGTFASRDQDVTNTHTYTLVVGNGDTDNAFFSITGEQLFANSAYDFEASNTHSIRVQTTDNDGGTYDSAMVIQVIDENDVPTDINYDALDDLIHPENEAFLTVVLTLTTEDQDNVDSHSYSLVAGVGDTHNTYFAILGNKVVIDSTLNFERESADEQETFYQFRIQTSDSIGGTFQKSFTIEITDENDAPHDILFPSNTIRHDKKAGDALGQFTVLDEDLNSFGEGDSHLFSLPSGKADNSNFSLDPNNPGFLYSGKDFSGNDIDSVFTVRILVRDDAGLVYEKDFPLTVIDANTSSNTAPLFISAVSTQLVDHNIIQAEFVQVVAEDDTGDTHTYELVAGIGDTHNQYFDSFNGDWLVANTSFDVISDSKFTVRVKATDNGGLSIEDTVNFTVIPFVDNEDPVLNLESPPNFVDLGTTLTIRADATDNTQVASVSLFYKGVFESEGSNYNEEINSNPNGDTYTFEILPSTYGPAGIEFYLVASDTSANTDTSEKNKIWMQFGGEANQLVRSEFLGFGGSKEDWKIFSIPYNLDEKSLQLIFGNDFGPYNKTEWRLVRWNDNGDGSGDYIDLPEIQGKIGLGESYWFNAIAEEVDIKIGSGSVNDEIPFPMELSPGFNQIGNPYNVPISWTKVLTNNGNPSDVGKYQVLSVNGQQDEDILNPFEGGFVYLNGAARTINIDPTISRPDVGGRLNKALPSSDLSNEQWLIELNIEANGKTYSLGSFGMHSEASIEKDEFDRLAVPRFQSFTEIYSKHEEYSYPWFRRDVVNSRNEYTWDFKYESNTIEGLASFIWNPDGFGDGFETLKLYNKENGELVDMRKQSSYQFEGGNSLKFAIFFSQDPNSIFVPDELLLGNAYPNPTDGNTVFPIVLPDTRDHYNLEINIYNLQGKLVDTIVKGIYEAGIHQFQYDFNSNQTTKGIYIYQLRFNDGFHMPVQKKIFIKR